MPPLLINKIFCAKICFLWYNRIMKKGLGFLVLIVGVFAFKNACFAGEAYTVVPMPDTIVQKTPIDAAIYNNTAEFFTPYIVNELNKTQFIKAPTVSDVRNKIQSDYWLAKSTTKAMEDFRKFYKLDFGFTKKIANLYNTNYVLLITSATDSTNYITRRTWWDFFNVPGASVLDPAYKINIYAVLIDTEKDLIVWNKTYQKTISVVENRIVAVGYAPQTEQLQKLKDYSVYLAPRVAQSIQDTLLTEAQKAVEANLIHTDYGSIDNVFTKKYRGLRKEIKDATVVPVAKTREGYGIAKEKYNELKEDYQEYMIRRQQEASEKEPSEGIKILPINFFKKQEKDPATNIVPVVEQSQKTVSETLNEVKSTTVTNFQKTVDTTKDNVKNVTTDTVVKTNEFINELKNDAVEVSVEMKDATSAKYEKAKEIVAPKVDEAKKQVVETKNNFVESTKETSKKVKEKAIEIPSDIDKRSKELLNKAFKNAPIEDDKDLPVDSLIYTHPTNYKTNEYLPVKPRLREITTDDTYNAF